MTEITLMRVEDVEAVHAIEEACFATPWSLASFLYEVTENQCARYLVMREDGECVAYAGMWFVRPDRRGRGYGTAITKALVQLAADSGMTWMTLECRRSNLIAQSIYRKLGFVDVGYRKRYYADNNEDALLMALEKLPEAHPENDPCLHREEEKLC